MNKNLKQGILLGFLLILLFIINNNKYTNKLKNIYGGEEGVEDDEGGEGGEGGENLNVKCSLEEIEKNNRVDNKWVYNNGTIYNLTTIINSKYMEIGTIDPSIPNIKNIITYFKNTQEQDLSKMLKSVDRYNENIRIYNQNVRDKAANVDNTDNIDAANADDANIDAVNIDAANTDTTTKDANSEELLEFQYEALGADQVLDAEQKQKQFNKFKFIFIKSILQFERGTICPAGLIY
tara:strand:- start:43 stop:750 length:708 start_codon:yes stop_codon:yes gene_type:complete